jgi:SAM-dependent methyltransferase
MITRSYMNSPSHERYVAKPGIGSSHSWAIGRCSRRRQAGAALDIGPGSGVLGQALRNLGWTELFAVETDRETRSHLASIYKEIQVDLSGFSGRRFDLILLLDVLEHLAQPEEFVAGLVEYLAPGGQMLISVPNITHWSVRAQLLLGMFQYSDRGLLDKTHLQFFTRFRLQRLVLAQPALKLEELRASVAPYELMLPKLLTENGFYRTVSRLRLTAAQLWPSLLAYQHLAVASKA